MGAFAPFYLMEAENGEGTKKMERGDKGNGFVINPLYRRTAVLRALHDSMAGGGPVNGNGFGLRAEGTVREKNTRGDGAGGIRRSTGGRKGFRAPEEEQDLGDKEDEEDAHGFGYRGAE